MKRKMMTATLSAAPVLLFALSEGPVPSVSGAPGENTCTMCHGGQPNTGKGKVTINFPSDSYMPGQTYLMQVTVSDPSAVRWGFELTARLDGSAGSQVGTLAEADGYTQVIAANQLQWIEHTVSGTRPGTRQSATFQFNWTAPSTSVGAVAFYVASVAANGDGAPTGDLVYTTSLKVESAPFNPAVPAPSFSASGVTDAWTAQAGIAPGAWITLTGTAIASGEANWSPTAGSPLPTTLGGVSVSVNDIPAAISHVTATSVTLLIPSSVTDGNAKIVVQRDGETSSPVWTPVTAALPSIYSVADPNANPPQYYASVTTAGAGLSLGLVNAKGGVLGTPAMDPRAVRGVYPGEQIDIYAAGLGATTPDFPTDRLFPSSKQVAAAVNVHFGDAVVAADAAALVEPGLYLVRVTVPRNVIAGMTALGLDVNGLASTASVLLKVESASGPAQ